MEIYKELNSPKNKEFETLLNSQLSKTKVQEGNVVVGTVTKITTKYIFLYIDGLKSEPIIDINEVSKEDLKEGSKLSVYLEKIEDSKGDVIVSAAKAQKIKGWKLLERAFENNEPILGKIKTRVKGGVIVEHIDTGSLMFCPGSQISDKPLKDISHLINEPQKFALIKLDKIRGAGPPTS